MTTYTFKQYHPTANSKNNIGDGNTSRFSSTRNNVNSQVQQIYGDSQSCFAGVTKKCFPDKIHADIFTFEAADLSDKKSHHCHVNTFCSPPNKESSSPTSTPMSMNLSRNTLHSYPVSESPMASHLLAQESNITFEQLQSLFDKPIREACVILGMSVTKLKILCRELNVPRWPYRKIKGIQGKIYELKMKQDKTKKKDLHRKISKEIEELEKELNLIIENPKQAFASSYNKKRTLQLEIETCVRELSKKRRMNEAFISTKPNPLNISDAYPLESHDSLQSPSSSLSLSNECSPNCQTKSPINDEVSRQVSPLHRIQSSPDDIHCDSTTTTLQKETTPSHEQHFNSQRDRQHQHVSADDKQSVNTSTHKRSSSNSPSKFSFHYYVPKSTNNAPSTTTMNTNVYSMKGTSEGKNTGREKNYNNNNSMCDDSIMFHNISHDVYHQQHNASVKEDTKTSILIQSSPWTKNSPKFETTSATTCHTLPSIRSLFPSFFPNACQLQ